LNRDAAQFAAILWAVRHGAPAPALPSAAAAPRDLDISEAAYAAMGYRVLGPRVLRVDRLERLAALARRLARNGPFGPVAELMALGGGSAEDLAAMLSALSYRVVPQEGSVTFHSRRAAKARRRKRRAPPADSPFAKLAELRLAQ
jgi:ATP-dependent RNA helicase SUPV3L1/SUV3